MIILAIQRYLISGAEISKSHGKYFLSLGSKSAFLSIGLPLEASAKWGQPKVDKGQSPEENQVSRTCSSCFQPAPGFSIDTFISATCPELVKGYQTGILCPHQRLREIHQSWISASQSVRI